MIRSMTAFARRAASSREGGWGIEIRSLNSRYFEFSLKISPVLNALENRIKEQVQSLMRRGKVTVSINQDSAEDSHNRLSIDEDTVRFYLQSIAKLKKKFKLQGDVTVSNILQLPGIFGGQESEQDPEKVWLEIKKILAKTLDLAVKAKKVEGTKLAKDIESRLQSVGKAVAAIEKQAAGQIEKIRRKLLERIEALAQEKALEPDRLEREVAFLAERMDITEELVRLKSHLDLFEKKLHEDGEAGRELDFLCQEMNREINTLGSKAQHFEISTQVVFVKGELEKIREQIQNIE